ncbi:hypothetical protein P692DRAFT_20878758 [Suillus brevipes Sb2]|nr:hypothetical protein P692DRAFT_20878758 [Suillus brevipes Sb2]
MTLGLDLGRPTVAQGTVSPAAVDAEIIPVQLSAQLTPATVGTLQWDSPAADRNVTPAVPILAQPDVPPAFPILDTPIKWDGSTLLPFTTLTRHRIDTLNTMGKEMQEHVVGPMPVENFLDELLPNPEDYDNSDFASRFASASNAEVFNLRSIKREEDSYKPFQLGSQTQQLSAAPSAELLNLHRTYAIKILDSLQIEAMGPFASQLSFVNTSKHADLKNCSSFTFNVMPDVCIYADGTSHGCDISKSEVIIEFKWADAHDAFSKNPRVDKPIVSQTDKGFDTLGQITSYAAAQLGAQYRAHAFSVLIVCNRARIIRWDREGAIVTNTFDYNHEPHLADFFHRFA